jgi:hypothetical protein
LAGEIFMLEANAIGARRAWVFDFFVLHLPLTRAPRTGRGATAHRAMSDEAPPPAEGEAPEDGEPEPEPEPPFTLTVSVKVRRGRSASARAAANRRIFPFATRRLFWHLHRLLLDRRRAPQRRWRSRPRAARAFESPRRTHETPTLTGTPCPESRRAAHPPRLHHHRRL